MKRLFDFTLALILSILLCPFMLIVGIIIVSSSKGHFLFLQDRVGKNRVMFKIYKFRTMVDGAEKKGLLSLGDKDPRITRVGYYLRKYKIDEIPQLFNVLKGEMSFVGPRPEVEKYVLLYTKNELKTLNVLPGITSSASMKYKNEPEILKQQPDPDFYYRKMILPDKLKLNLLDIENQSFWYDLKIMMRTLLP